MINNKKILFVLPRMGGGGAERVTAIVANALAKGNNKVTIFTLVGGESFYPLNSAIDYDSVNITVNRKNKLMTYISEGIALPRSIYLIRNLIKKEKFDIVISILIETDIIVGICRLTGLKFKHVCSERNDPTRRNKLQLQILKNIYQKADLFICQSKKVADFYTCVPERKKIIIENPIDQDSLPTRPKTTSKRIVAVGRLTAQKNFPLLIKSFSSICKEYPEYTLEIYGEGESRTQLESLIDSLDLKNRVVLKGASQTVQSNIADAELFVMSSDYEGFPNALLEAMAIGLPVISTDFSTGVARELIGRENGIVVPIGNEPKMTKAILYLLRNSELRKKMSKANRIKCRKYYTSEIVSKWSEALSELC